MDLLAATPLDEQKIQEIRARHPSFTGKLPPQAKFWREADLDAFFGSSGEVLPQDGGRVADDLSSCALLARLRGKLAEAKIDAATAEHRSFCRHIRERAEDVRQLPGAAACAEVPRQARAPELLKAPVLVERVRMWVGRRWNAAFWRREMGGAGWKCRARAPAFEGDLASHADALAEVCTAAEYVDYVHVLQQQDPLCEEDKGLAYPRVTFYDWPAFSLGAKALFDNSWRELAPPGVTDYSLRWLRRWSAVCRDMPAMDQFARMHRVTIAAAGTVSRLHVENYSAHVWLTQIEGSRMFFLFPPQARGLYEESGGGVVDPETVHAYTSKASPVDIFFPNRKRHPLFADAKAQVAVLNPGESLVVPSGWWQHSVALEMSVTLHHAFWNVTNRGGVVDAVRDLVVGERQHSPETMEQAQRCLDEFYELVMDDDDPEDAEFSD
uniref:JmjC domain-containing protein n=1 Tax=Zooxanthella nutricula TaxID=1333877 RepID=A0A6U9LT67_9DINO